MGDSNTPYFAEGAVCKAIPRLVLCGYHIRPYLPTCFWPCNAPAHRKFAHASPIHWGYTGVHLGARHLAPSTSDFYLQVIVGLSRSHAATPRT